MIRPAPSSLPTSRQSPGSAHASRGLPPLGLASPASCAAGSAALGLVRRLQTSYEQDFSPAGRGQSPWCQPDRGWTLQADGGNHDRWHDGNFRCDTHWCRGCCSCNCGARLCGGGGLVYPGFPLNVGAQLARVAAPMLVSPARYKMVMARLRRLAMTQGGRCRCGHGSAPHPGPRRGPSAAGPRLASGRARWPRVQPGVTCGKAPPRSWAVRLRSRAARSRILIVRFTQAGNSRRTPSPRPYSRGVRSRLAPVHHLVPRPRPLECRQGGQGRGGCHRRRRPAAVD